MVGTRVERIITAFKIGSLDQILMSGTCTWTASRKMTAVGTCVRCADNPDYRGWTLKEKNAILFIFRNLISFPLTDKHGSYGAQVGLNKIKKIWQIWQTGSSIDFWLCASGPLRMQILWMLSWREPVICGLSYQHGPIIIVIELTTLKVKHILLKGLVILRWLFLQRFEVADLLSS